MQKILPNLSTEERDSVIEEAEITRFTLGRLSKAISRANIADHYKNNEDSITNQY